MTVRHNVECVAGRQQHRNLYELLDFIYVRGTSYHDG